MAGAAKRHHYVPQCLIRNFCDESGRVWFSERDERGLYKCPEQRNTKSVFYENYYYSIEVRGRPSDYIEKSYYQKIDDRLAILIGRVLDCERRGCIDLLRGEVRELSWIVYALLVRNPNFIAKFVECEISTGREIVERALRHSNLEENQRFFAEKLLSSRQELKKLGRTARVSAQVSPPSEVAPYLDALSAKIVRCSGRHSFIISDFPVYRIGNGGANGLRNINSEMWLPISPKVALVLLNESVSAVPDFNVLDRDRVREINVFAVRNSAGVASHSRQLISSLLR